MVGGGAAAEASECADEQGGFWEYHDELFANIDLYNSDDDFVALAESFGLDGGAFRECLESDIMQDEVIADAEDARSYGVSGTPTFFINGVRLVGAQPIESFNAIIEEELANQ